MTYHANVNDRGRFAVLGNTLCRSYYTQPARPQHGRYVTP